MQVIGQIRPEGHSCKWGSRCTALWHEVRGYKLSMLESCSGAGSRTFCSTCSTSKLAPIPSTDNKHGPHIFQATGM
eukprot:3466147-Amphidinium_carterae.1